MENEKLLKDFPNEEKGAYLGAIASLATADHVASEEEVGFLERLADAAGVTPAQKTSVIKAATEISGEELEQCLEILKNSDLRFSLLTDLISFAKSDNSYSEEEKAVIKKMADRLKINNEQFTLLDEFVDKTSDTDVSPEEVKQPGFLEKLGLGDKFKNAGINWKNAGKGLLAIAGPLILAKMLSGRRNSSGSGGPGGASGGGAGSVLGGGLGSLFGGEGNGRTSAGGIGSLISGLSGGRGFGGTGGLLSKIFGRF